MTHHELASCPHCNDLIEVSQSQIEAEAMTCPECRAPLRVSYDVDAEPGERQTGTVTLYRADADIAPAMISAVCLVTVLAGVFGVMLLVLIGA